jgi:hypothetical protein
MSEKVTVTREPSGPWKRRLTIGHHSRSECLMWRGRWCLGIGDHPGMCARCPLRHPLDRPWRGLG